MSTAEMNSLEEIQYKSKIQKFILIFLCSLLFVFSFISYFPIGDKIKSMIQTPQSQCKIDFDDITFEWFLPKLVIKNLDVPAQCLGKSGESYTFDYVKASYQLVSFSPLGLPFKLETELNGLPITLYYVQGIGVQHIRLKDHEFSLNKLESLIGNKFKLNGRMLVDLTLKLKEKSLQELELKVSSKDIAIPSQNIQGFNLAKVNLQELYIEAESSGPDRINVSKFIIGDASSAVRANFKGKINLNQEMISFSMVDLTGEVAFSESFKQNLPLIDLLFGSYTQKDGFYQMRLSGTLGSIQPTPL